MASRRNTSRCPQWPETVATTSHPPFHPRIGYRIYCPRNILLDFLATFSASTNERVTAISREHCKLQIYEDHRLIVMTVLLLMNIPFIPQNFLPRESPRKLLNTPCELSLDSTKSTQNLKENPQYQHRTSFHHSLHPPCATVLHINHTANQK